jgi:hypothetical protein
MANQMMVPSGRGAGGAAAGDFHGVVDVGEAVIVGDLGGPQLHGRPLDLHGVPAVPAHQVVMVVC